MNRVRHAARALVGVLAAAVVLTGCDFDVYKLPLPGGTDVGDRAITVKAEFQDVLDLVPKSTVKVNDVSVGQVTDVSLQGQHAVVTMKVRRDAGVPANATAQIRQTSLLGEKFISLGPPAGEAPQGRMADGTEIPLSETGRNPEVEEVLGALSLLLNGGGVAQLKTISTEVSNVLDGREDEARSVLQQIKVFMQQLDRNKTDIVNAIDSVNRLAKSVRAQQASIDSALDELPSALTSLDRQRGDLVKMLQALDRLSDVGVRVIEASKTNTIESLRQLDPVLTGLADSGDNFVKSFQVFLTYPFVDDVVGRDPQVARNLHMGDYTNLSVRLDLDFSGSGGGGTPTLLPGPLDPTQVAGLLARCLASTSKDSAACRKLLSTAEGVRDLQAACAKPENKDAAICKAIASGPRLPTSGGASAPSVGGLLGIGRTGVGASAVSRGPTYAALSARFDPALVRLLVPGMVSTR